MQQEADRLLSQASAVEPSITASLQAIAAAIGCTMYGLPFRFKSRDSLARKLETLVSEGLTPSEAVTEIRDALRYTIVVETEHYAFRHRTVLDVLNSFGYEVVRINNYWHRGDYKGINAVLSFCGQTFELQFHTPESINVKENQSHPVYEKLRVCKSRSWATRYSRMLSRLWLSVAVPAGV